MSNKWPNVPKMVKTMYEAQGGLCGYCGTPAMFIRTEVSEAYHTSHKLQMATFEHIVLDSEGGKYELENGVCICAECNTLRANRPLEEFFDNYDALLQHLREKPLRVAAKRKLNNRKNGYMIAWFAKYIGMTVDDIFLIYTPDNSYDIARKSL